MHFYLKGDKKGCVKGMHFVKDLTALSNLQKKFHFAFGKKRNKKAFSNIVLKD